MKVEQYLQQLENACNKSLAANVNHGVRGAKIAQLNCIEELRKRLKRLEELENQIQRKGNV